jgi:hypothetical protein
VSDDPVPDDAVLDDGEHEAIVVDVEDGVDGSVMVELTLVTGPTKGTVVRVRATGISDPLELLGIPATITVTDGAPRVRFEP